MLMLDANAMFLNFFMIRTATEYAELHSHDFFEIMYVKRGKIKHIVNGGAPVTMNEGDYMFINIGDIHEFSGTEFEVVNLMFYPEFIDNRYVECHDINELIKRSQFGLKSSDCLRFPSAAVLTDSNGAILTLTNLIKNELLSGKSLMYKNAIKHLLIAILLIIANDNADVTPGFSPITAAVLEIIESNYNEDNLLVKASEKTHYSMQHISAKFKADMGRGFKEYLQEYRINKAKYLLGNTDKPIVTICSDVGYSDTKFFYSLFKKYTGETPMQYRKKAKNLCESFQDI